MLPANTSQHERLIFLLELVCCSIGSEDWHRHMAVTYFYLWKTRRRHIRTVEADRGAS